MVCATLCYTALRKMVAVQAALILLEPSRAEPLLSSIVRVGSSGLHQPETKGIYNRQGAV